MTQRVLRALGIAALGFVAASLGNAFNGQHGIAVFWPANGMLAAALFLAPDRRLLYVAGIAGRALADVAMTPWPAAAIYVACDAVEIATWVVLVRWLWRNERSSAVDAHVAVRLLPGCIVGPLVSSVVAGLWFVNAYHEPFVWAASTWWTADFLGGLIGFPAMLGWLRIWHDRHAPIDWRAASEAIAVVAITTGAAVLVFAHGSSSIASAAKLPQPEYMLFPLLIWSALRFRPAVTTSAIFGATLAAMYALTLGHIGSPSSSELFGVQTFIGVAGFSSTLLALKSGAQRRLIDELAVSEAQLRALAERLERAREEERARISRDIHDVVGQGLTAIKLALGAVEVKAPCAAGGPRGCTADVHALIDRNIEFARALAFELRPSSLDRLGLAGAMAAHLDRFGRTAGLVCRASLGTAGDALRPAQALAAFRVFQEALTNAARHARATEISVDAIEDEHEFVLEVADNGVGLSAGAASDSSHLGLVGMRERLMPFHGAVEFDRPPSGGTIVRVRLPLDADAREDAWRRAS